MTNKLKKNNGITLASVVVTVLILVILSTMIALRASESVNTNKLNKMYNDIKILQDRILIYYSETGQIPKGSRFDISSLKEEFQTQKNQLDDNNAYYEIDVSKLDNITLSFGDKKGTDDVYIVNEKTLSVYYAKGITLKGKTYYAEPKEDQKTEFPSVSLEDKKNRKTIEEGLGIVNVPDLKQGMTPIVYLNDESAQKVGDVTNDYWYDYSREVMKFANMMLNDGSIYVWIPRFAVDSSGENIKFVDIENKWYNNSAKTYEDVTGTGYTVSDIFNYNGQNLTGIWIAKYEASGEKEKVVIVLNADKTTEIERWGRALSDLEKIDKTSNITLIEANGLNRTQNKSLLIEEKDKLSIKSFIGAYGSTSSDNNKYAICLGSSRSNLMPSDITTSDTSKDNFSFRPKIISVASNYNTTNENIAYETSEDVPIPKGFYYLMGTKDTGLVITADYKGREGKDNEFVWIPVDYANFKRYDWTGWDGNPEHMDTLPVLDNTTSEYKEAGPEGDSLATDESIEMYSSVETYGGFYVARYELVLDNYPGITNSGDGYYTHYRYPMKDHIIPKSMSTNNFFGDNGDLRSIIWPGEFKIIEDGEEYGVVTLARSMYPNMNKLEESGLGGYKGISNETGVISTLIYGVQWDAIMYYLKNVENGSDKYILNSSGKGNYTNPQMLAKTNNYFVNNICDLAGNLAEWTMEGIPQKSQNIARGGAAVWTAWSGGDIESANARHLLDSSYVNLDLCGRATLYIKK